MPDHASWERSLLFLLGLTVFAGPVPAVSIDWVLVGSPGNAADTPSTNCWAANCGSVAAPYRISRFEVTNAHYAEFLNAKAVTNRLLGLYSTYMGSHAQGGITRSGSSGSYAYAVRAGFADKPVNFVTFWDAVRFTNWLHNGQGSGDTETGAYTLLGGTPTPANDAAVARNPGARVFLPSENEWYKAAYYDALSATYFDYPAGTDMASGCSAPTAMANHANCGGGAGGVTRVGAYAGSASPYGTFDQGGNVAEWNEDGLSSNRGLRGGSWYNVADTLAASDRNRTVTYVEDSGVGFRVATSVVPVPTAALLLASGLAGLAAQRARRKRTGEA